MSLTKIQNVLEKLERTGEISMNRNARRRVESVRQSKAQAARDAAYQAKCERDGLTPEQRRDHAMGVLANTAATLALAGIQRAYR